MANKPTLEKVHFTDMVRQAEGLPLHVSQCTFLSGDSVNDERLDQQANTTNTTNSNNINKHMTNRMHSKPQSLTVAHTTAATPTLDGRECVREGAVSS